MDISYLGLIPAILVIIWKRYWLRNKNILAIQTKY
jgi:hypothetical protein